MTLRLIRKVENVYNIICFMFYVFIYDDTVLCRSTKPELKYLSMKVYSSVF